MTSLPRIVGLQGGRGSFNEQAAVLHLGDTGIDDFELRYLHTTENVIKALKEGSVDFGQFAVHNSLGGEVEESTAAMNGHELDIVARYKIRVSHVLMISPDADIAHIDTVMTHPQVLRQCRKNLEKRYGHLKLVSGEGELIDPAKVAELLANKKLPKNIAVASSANMAAINRLNIVAENLQDADDNYTTFILVKQLENNAHGKHS